MVDADQIKLIEAGYYQKWSNKNPAITAGIKVCWKWRHKSGSNHGGSDLITTASLNIPSAAPSIHVIKPSNNKPKATLFTKSKRWM
jgi:hypothetical protein